MASLTPYNQLSIWVAGEMVSKILTTVKLFIVLYRNFFGKKYICVSIADRFIAAMY